jgi:hypothetical protein
VAFLYPEKGSKIAGIDKQTTYDFIYLCPSIINKATDGR